MASKLRLLTTKLILTPLRLSLLISKTWKEPYREAFHLHEVGIILFDQSMSIRKVGGAGGCKGGREGRK